MRCSRSRFWLDGSSVHRNTAAFPVLRSRTKPSWIFQTFPSAKCCYELHSSDSWSASALSRFTKVLSICGKLSGRNRGDPWRIQMDPPLLFDFMRSGMLTVKSTSFV